jgi:hypothetical protein
MRPLIRVAIRAPMTTGIWQPISLWSAKKPGSAKGVTFITIEDETSIANLVIRPDLYEKQQTRSA